MEFLLILTPFLLASTGGLYSELSGTTNVSMEGYITMGGFLTITFTKLTDSLCLGILLTITLIIILSLLHSLATIRLKANPIITGLAVNMGFLGIISSISFRLFQTKGVLILNRTRPINTWPIILIALIFPILTIFILKSTRFGLRLKARGHSKKILTYSNVNPDFYRITAITISSISSALAGIFLALQLRSFIPNLSAGRGWIALVIIFLGRKNPIGIFIGCSIFTATQIFSNMSQSLAIPSDLVLALPYLLTLVALILSHLKKRVHNS